MLIVLQSSSDWTYQVLIVLAQELNHTHILIIKYIQLLRILNGNLRRAHKTWSQNGSARNVPTFLPISNSFIIFSRNIQSLLHFKCNIQRPSFYVIMDMRLVCHIIYGVASRWEDQLPPSSLLRVFMHVRW